LYQIKLFYFKLEKKLLKIGINLVNYFTRHSWVENTGQNSLGDINDGTMELDSVESSPGVQRVCRFLLSFNLKY
jgi:hypothetical protein